MAEGLRIGANIGIAMALSDAHINNGECLVWQEDANRYTLDPDCPVCRDISEATGIPLTYPEELQSPVFDGLTILTT